MSQDPVNKVLSGFRHKMTVHVRFSEIDMLGVCNNVVYLSYFEEARVQYLKQAGLLPKNGIFTDGSEYYIVRNEINYRGFARHDNELAVYSRINFIKRSSYGFEHVVSNVSTNKIIADGSGVIVRVDPSTGKSMPIDKTFRDKIRELEPDIQLR